MKIRSFRQRRTLLVFSALALCFMVMAFLHFVRRPLQWEELYEKLPSTLQPQNNGWRGEFEELMRIYLRRLEEMTNTVGNDPNETCPADFNSKPHRTACFVEGCNASFPHPKERLRRILQTQHPIDKKHQTVIDNLANKPDYADLVFITAASANHFDESQGLVKGLQEVVFPRLQEEKKYSFHFYYYDLGLKEHQVKQLEKHCRNCTVMRFPFQSLPPNFQKLGTCIWKPLLIKAHLHFSSMTLWMDASVRFRTADITPILEQARHLGVFVARTQFMMPMHVHPAMLSYFQVQPCLLAPFYETAGGFIVLHNDSFVQLAILDPWVACAFSPRCICPSEKGTDCNSLFSCTMRNDPYFRCHRFDQSALGIILASLFDLKVTALTHKLVDNTITWFAFRRGQLVNYFAD